jgi:hypothetical protein
MIEQGKMTSAWTRRHALLIVCFPCILLAEPSDLGLHIAFVLALGKGNSPKQSIDIIDVIIFNVLFQPRPNIPLNSKHYPLIHFQINTIFV